MAAKDYLKQKVRLQMWNNNIKFIFIGSLSSIVIFIMGFDLPITNEGTIQLYITPRNVNYGWADNGVYKFSLEQASIKVPYSKRSYSTQVITDSLYELFYIKFSKTINLNRLIENSHSTLKNTKFLFPRILLIVDNGNKKDTLSIDRNFSVFYEKQVFLIDKKLESYLLQKMPIEIRDNWIFDRRLR